MADRHSEGVFPFKGMSHLDGDMAIKRGKLIVLMGLFLFWFGVVIVLGVTVIAFKEIF